MDAEKKAATLEAPEAPEAPVLQEALPIQDVPPHPVPMTFKISQVNDGKGGFGVQLVGFTPTGTTVWFFDPQLAKSLAEAINKVADISQSGLILPGGGA